MGFDAVEMYARAYVARLALVSDVGGDAHTRCDEQARKFVENLRRFEAEQTAEPEQMDPSTLPTERWEVRVYHSQAHEPDVVHAEPEVQSARGAISHIKMYSPEEYPETRIYVLAPNDASDEQIAAVRAALAARGDDRTDLVQRWNELQA